MTEEDFYRLHGKLVAVFLQKGVPREEARDLSQETLLRVHRDLTRFRGSSQLDTWAISIAKNLWLQHCRHRGRQKRAGTVVPLDAGGGASTACPPSDAEPSPETQAHLKGYLAQVLNEMRKLPDEMRQALTMHAVGGHKYREIAVVLGISENRVSSLIRQARQKLGREARGAPATSHKEGQSRVRPS